MQALLGPPRSQLAKVDVEEALGLGRGASVRHGVDVLDATDALTAQKLVFESGSVTWSYRAPDRVVGQSGELAAVRRQGTLLVPGVQAANLNAVRLRLWTEWQLLSGGWARFHLGVFTVVNPGALTDDGRRVTKSLTLADKSYRWANTFLPEPLTVAAGTVIVDWVKARLTSRFGENRFALPASGAVLDQPRTFEAGLSELEVMSQVLEAGALDQLIADELGRPSTRPLSDLATKSAETTYGAGQGKVLQAGQVEPLLPTMPNVVRFSARQGPSLGNVEGNGLRTVRNQSTGPASIDARGGVEVELRVDVDADSQSVLDQIATADAQRYFAGGGMRWTGQVGLNPRHSDRDVIALALPNLALDLADAWNVTEWTYPLQPFTAEQSALMPITAERRVALS